MKTKTKTKSIIGIAVCHCIGSCGYGGPAAYVEPEGTTDAAGEESTPPDAAPCVEGSGFGPDRSPLAGLHTLWGPYDDSSIELPVVKGAFATGQLSATVASGNYADLDSIDPWQAVRTIGEVTENVAGGPKGIQLSINGPKSPDWQKHVWYAESDGIPISERPKKTEQGGWIGAYWTEDGIDVMKGAAAVNLEVFDSYMTPAQRERTIGIRINYSAISNEGTHPGEALSDTDHPNWRRGSLASATRPPDYSATRQRDAKRAFLSWLADTVMVDGDDGDPRYPIFVRASSVSDPGPSPVSERIDGFFRSGKWGLLVTSLEHEPRSAAHAGEDIGALAMRRYCRDYGNTRCLTEAFGESVYASDGPQSEGDNDIQANFTHLQFQYWMSLHSLSLGTTFVGWRTKFAQNWNLEGNDALREEWRATMRFVDKYAGYIQFPARAPGAWVALREGNRNPGNYDFLAEQIVGGDADRGQALWAGTNGSQFLYPSDDYVGPGSGQIDVSAGDVRGAGQRQSMWAFRFGTGEKLKIKLDERFAASLSCQDAITVNVHYLDVAEAPTRFAVTAFNHAVGTAEVNNSGDWKVASFVVNASDVAVDADGAHVIVELISGSVMFHMIEVTRA